MYLGSNSNVVNPTFNDVTIANSTTTTTTTYADFVPVMNPTELTGGDKTILFVTGGNKLTYPNTTGYLNGFRAYFKLNDGAAASARSFTMSFDDLSNTTVIDNVELTVDNDVYDLHGRKIMINDQRSMVNYRRGCIS